MEVWKNVPNYEGLYQVSSLGMVQSLERVVKRSDNQKKTFKERFLKANPDGHGYLMVTLSKDGKRKTFKVHKLVAMAFLGHKPCGYREVVDHIDNDKLNNRAENLQLTTQRNNASKDRKGTSKYTGVTWYKPLNKWRAKIYTNGKHKYLGYFTCELEASQAYQEALKTNC